MKFKFLSALMSLLVAITATAHDGKKHAPASAVKKVQRAWGIAGDAKSANRTVAISMTDTMRFAPDTVRVKLGRGDASDTVWTCDLSHDYVSINADYRS